MAAWSCHVAGLDVSMKETHICVVDRDGGGVLETTTAALPEAIAAALGPFLWQRLSRSSAIRIYLAITDPEDKRSRALIGRSLPATQHQNVKKSLHHRKKYNLCRRHPPRKPCVCVLSVRVISPGLAG
jgi:hypothetical protein